MKSVTFFVLAAALLAGCSKRILVDEVVGRTTLPCPRVPDLGIDRPGALVAGIQGTIRKPSETSWKVPTGDTLVAGRQSWTLPAWSLGGHLAWTPFEGLTFVPEGFVAGRGDALYGDGSAAMGMHAEAGWIAWQLEARVGVSWVRSVVRWRTRVEDVVLDATWLDSLEEERHAGIAPWTQLGLQLQSAIPRQPVQLWALCRWGVRDPKLLSDSRNGELLPEAITDWQIGAGMHRRVGKRSALTLGVVRDIQAPPGMGSADATTEFVVQWDLALLKGGQVR